MRKFINALEMVGWVGLGLFVLLMVFGICSIFFPSEKYYAITQDVDQIACIKVRYVDWDADEVYDWGEIPPECYQEFITELTQITMTSHTPPVTGVEGLAYQIEYQNGEYEMISSCVVYYSETNAENGSFHFNDTQFEALWEKYGRPYED